MQLASEYLREIDVRDGDLRIRVVAHVSHRTGDLWYAIGLAFEH